MNTLKKRVYNHAFFLQKVRDLFLMNTLPTFQSNTQYFGDSTMPHIVSLRPVTTGGRNASFAQIIQTIAGSIREVVAREVMRYTGWSSGRVLREVRGKLLASNEYQGDVHGYTRTFTALDDVTHEAIYEVFEDIQSSNSLVLITDIVWEFHIAPTSIAVGGSYKIKPPSWCNSIKYRRTWEGHEGVNCAALALVYLMYSTEKRYDNSFTRALQDAKALQQEMNWEETISLDQLQTFVDKYPMYRLSAFLPHCPATPFTFTGAAFEFPDEFPRQCPNNILYLVYDPTQKHFAATKSPGQILTKIKGYAYQWCHKCIVGYNPQSGHTCEDGIVLKKRKIGKPRPCTKCGIIGKHVCQFVSCRFCHALYKKAEGWDHRCIVYKEERKEKENIFYSGHGELDGSLPCLWVYDFESCIKIEDSVRQVISDFRVDGNGHYLENQDVLVYDFSIQKHEVNFVAFRNVFTDEEKTFFGPTALRDFILFMLEFNSGNNICIAHNASGYDTRLLFTECKTLQKKVQMTPIMRGGKFMQLTLNKNTIFRDSLLHVRGSLKALAKDFCNGLLKKGYFPHLFNSVEHYGYNGPIPPKKYFDLSFTVRSKKDQEEFDEWYNSFTGDWNFMDQLTSYCINDVLVLQKIVKGYHDIAFATFGMSPWMNATAPSFVHDVFLIKLGKELELPDRKENKDEYLEKVVDLAWNDYWAVLKPAEYWFARKALRGGRTEIRKLTHTVSDEDWMRGVRIRYQDICSQYPFQQVTHDFPVGLPTMFVWDRDYVPCVEHQNDPIAKCNCRHRLVDKFCKVEQLDRQWTKEEILNKKDFFGIVCATVEPPKNIYHPVLVAFDEKLKKSVASCETIIEGVFTSVEFVVALQHGYTLVKLHRYDEYNRKPSLWKDIVLDLFLEKMINSKAAPTGEVAEKLISDYENLFGEAFGDKIRDSIAQGRWGKNPAKKQTAKIMMNSAWGKHAQRPIMPEAKVFNFQEDRQEILDFFENCVSQNFEYHDGTYLNDNQILYKYSVSGPNTKPNLHGGYLPAALFVPAYGRLQLWEQLNRLGKRVLMNDTDSIVYIYDPELYNIPEGSLLGEWEVEDVDKDHGGIRSFVGLGPKTYGIKCDDGFSMVKAKGLSLNLATEKLVNFETMVEVARSRGVVQVPQKTFVWSVENGMKTWLMLKDLRINEAEMKGYMDQEGHLYPFGFSE